MRLIFRLLLSSFALLISPYIISGVSVANFYTALIAAIILGVVNAVIRPILIILTLPITVLTLGLFTLVINSLLVLFVASFVKGFSVIGFWPAFFLSLFLWLTSWFINLMLKD